MKFIFKYQNCKFAMILTGPIYMGVVNSQVVADLTLLVVYVLTMGWQNLRFGVWEWSEEYVARS